MRLVHVLCSLILLCEMVYRTMESVKERNLYLALALGQQLVAHPVLVRKIACAALVGVVLAQHAVRHVAPMVSVRLHTSSLSLPQQWF